MPVSGRAACSSVRVDAGKPTVRALQEIPVLLANLSQSFTKAGPEATLRRRRFQNIKEIGYESQGIAVELRSRAVSYR